MASISNDISSNDTKESCSLTEIHRYTPIGTLDTDAPGWGSVSLGKHPVNDSSSSSVENNKSDQPQQEEEPTQQQPLQEDMPPPTGPICWKCRGEPQRPVKQARISGAVCKVCCGHGRLPPRRASLRRQVGRITRACLPDDYVLSGPPPAALASSHWAVDLIRQQADQGHHVDLDDSVVSKARTANHNNNNDDEQPLWIPGPGEELCRLTGAWRILQRVQSHRWTTDDLVTAWCAIQTQFRANKTTARTSDNDDTRPNKIRYLDLGTGNGSVLHMVLWALQDRIEYAEGLEARLEAVELARRSLSYNLDKDPRVHIQHADFRSFGNDNNDDEENRFDLVTGTPPYFKVDFHVDTSSQQVVKKAVIQQGGMPTATASAPARCEFRGGIEAYLETAERCLRTGPDSRVVVCENWANHLRVLQAIQGGNLQLLQLVQVQGKAGRGTLFAVYVLGWKADSSNSSNGSNNQEKEEPERITLTVRNEQGKWTRQYLDTVMKDMSMPTMPADREPAT